jgi:hypothetical protein
MSAGTLRIWQTMQLLLREAWHLRLSWAVGGLVVGLVGAAAVLRDLNFGAAEARFLIDAARAAVGLGGVLLTALVGPTLFFSGLSSHMTSLLFVRQVSRAQWLLAQWFVLLALGGAVFAACAVSLVFVLATLGHTAAIPAGVGVLASGAGPIVLLAGIALLASAIARSPILATLLTVAAAICGHLAPVVRTMAQGNGLMAWLWRALDWLVPDFTVFSGTLTLVVAAYAVAGSLVAVAAAHVVLKSREL